MDHLGIYIDADLSMQTHVLRTAGRCFAALHQICSIRLSVTRPVLESHVMSLVLSRLDYRTRFFLKSLLESPGNLLEICLIKFLDTLIGVMCCYMVCR